MATAPMAGLLGAAESCKKIHKILKINRKNQDLRDLYRGYNGNTGQRAGEEKGEGGGCGWKERGGRRLWLKGKLCWAGTRNQWEEMSSYNGKIKCTNLR
jgi:hypothetical protein